MNNTSDAFNESSRPVWSGVNRWKDPSTEKDATSNGTVQLIFYAFYGNIFVVGVFGNALVCFVVARNRRMQTVTNLFITNLALSDVLLCALAVPFTPLYTFLGGWIFGRTLCHLVPYAQGVSVYVSTFTLTSIAIDRFLVIVYPFHPRTRIEVCLSVICGIWIIALTVTLPYGLYMRLEESGTETGMEMEAVSGSDPDSGTGTKARTNIYCEEHWPNERFRKAFSSVTAILQFALPFFVIVFCYARVSIKLNDRARSKPGTQTGERERADRERKKRTNRMLIAMVTVFGVSWLPLNVVNVIDDFYSPANDWSFYRLCFFMAHCLAMSSTCYNPFLYAWLNDNFRKEFKQVLPCFPKTSDNHGPTAIEEKFQRDKARNGNNTLQESMLPSQTRIRVSAPEGYELIILEPTTTNASRNTEDQVL